MKIEEGKNMSGSILLIDIERQPHYNIWGVCLGNIPYKGEAGT